MNTSASRPLLILLVLATFGILVGAGGFTFVYAKGYSYLSNDPKACVNCHIMRDQYSGWQKSSHHTVAACNDCHVPHAVIPKYLTKMENGYAHSRAFTMQDFKEPIEMRPVSKAIVQANCLECHSSLVTNVAAHDDPPGQALDCLQCHSGVGHGPRK